MLTALRVVEIRGLAGLEALAPSWLDLASMMEIGSGERRTRSVSAP